MANLRVNKIAAVGVSTENTGSVFFDGTNDYLSIADSDDFSFGSGDFTIEGFIYPTGIPQGSYATLVTPGLSLQTYFMSSNSLSLYVGSDGSSYNMITTANATGTDSIFQNEWSHFALTRSGNTFRYFINGIEKYTNTVAGTIYNDLTPLGIGDYTTAPGTYEFQGYMSNIRICKGHAVYTENFTVPTRELEVHPETVLLCCHDGENIFSDKSGRHIIAAYGDRLSSPTPTATDSPIGITTFNPGLTRNVDATDGPTFQGGAGFVSQNWLTLPKGTTTDRNRTGGRGVYGGGYSGAATLNSIEFITISSMGNAQDFGDLITASRHKAGGGVSSPTRGVTAGGFTSSNTNVIEFFTIASTGNTVDFGADLTSSSRNIGQASNSTRGLFAGGDSHLTAIDFITIATTGTCSSFGSLPSPGRANFAGCASPTRAIFGGGYTPSPAGATNTIEFVTIASTGDSTDFGDLNTARFDPAACSSSTRGIFATGMTPSYINSIEYVTISTLGNAQDFGDVTLARRKSAGMSNSIRGVFAGGSEHPNYYNTIDYITIATTGNASDFGDLITQRSQPFGCSDSHGGLG